MQTVLPYCAEYAKTATVWCKLCGQMILRDTVQIGIMQQVNITYVPLQVS